MNPLANLPHPLLTRLLFVLGATIVALAVGVTFSSTHRASADDSVAATVVAKNLAFEPPAITVRSGQSITLTFQNNDESVPHNLVIQADGVAPSATCTGPCSDTIVFTAPTPGSYTLVCTLHEFLGMTGTLEVQ